MRENYLQMKAFWRRVRDFLKAKCVSFKEKCAKTNEMETPSPNLLQSAANIVSVFPTFGTNRALTNIVNTVTSLHNQPELKHYVTNPARNDSTATLFLHIRKPGNSDLQIKPVFSIFDQGHFTCMCSFSPHGGLPI